MEPDDLNVQRLHLPSLLLPEEQQAVLPTVVVAGSTVPAARRSDLVAGDDAGAMTAWLREYHRKPDTLRAYRREARRFLLWMTVEQHTNLASLTRQDLAAYEAFLAKPPASWLPTPLAPAQGAADARQMRSWAPLKAPMPAAGCRRSLIILQGMLSWLVDDGYISRNPARLIRDKGAEPPRKGREVPNADCMTTALQALREHADVLANETSMLEREICRLARRDALVWAWIYYTGARRHEFAESRASSLTRRRDQTAYQWWWAVDGKGDQVIEVPVVSAAIDVLAWFHGVDVAQLLEKLRASPDDALLPKVRGDYRQGIGGSEVYESVRRGAAVIVGQATKLCLAAEDVVAIHKARPHDLRAFRTTHLLDAGADLRDVQRQMRHKDINTTLRYDHRRDRRFHAGIEAASQPTSRAAVT